MPPAPQVRVRCREVTAAGSGAPAKRSSHGACALGDGALMLFGGEATAREPIGSDAWILADADGDAKWSMVPAEEGKSPPARVGHAQARVQDRAYVFGGRDAVAVGEGGLNDLWAFDGARWESVATKGDVPAARSYHVMKASASQLFVFGGCGAEGRLADFHAMDVRDGTWRALSPAPIRGRGGASLFVNPDGTTATVVAGFCGEETRDVVVFDAVKGAWREPTTPAWLRPRSVCPHDFDAQSGAAIIFGGEVDPSNKGHAGAGDFASDLVALDLEGNEVAVEVASGSDAPAARGWGALASVAPGVAVMFGGLAGTDDAPERLGDTWLLRIDAA